MKSELKKIVEEKKPLDFPKLMVTKDNVMVVLFTSISYGAVVYAKEKWEGQLGYISTNWDMEDFKDYEGRIILEN